MQRSAPTSNSMKTLLLLSLVFASTAFGATPAQQTGSDEYEQCVVEYGQQQWSESAKQIARDARTSGILFKDLNFLLYFQRISNRKIYGPYIQNHEIEAAI